MNHTQIKQQEGEGTMDQRVGWGFHHVMELHYQQAQPTNQSINPAKLWGLEGGGSRYQRNGGSFHHVIGPHSQHNSQLVNEPHTTKTAGGWRDDGSESWLRPSPCHKNALPAHTQPISQSTTHNNEGWKVADQGIREMVEASTMS